MAELNAQFVKVVEDIAREWGLVTLTELQRVVKRKKLVNTGQLLQSLDESTRTDLGKVLTAIDFAYKDYGRYLDMKSNFYSSQPPVDAILEWVRKKGVGFFGADPHPYKRKVKTTQRRMNEIAWGIARSRAVGKRTRQRPWLQTPFWASVADLQEQLLIAGSDFAIEQMSKTLSERLKNS